MILFDVIGGHIIKPLAFLEFLRFLNASVPHLGLLFLNPPPTSFFCQPFFHTAVASYFDYTRKLSPPQSYVLPLGEESGVPLRFNNEFGVNVNLDPNK